MFLAIILTGRIVFLLNFLSIDLQSSMLNFSPQNFNRIGQIVLLEFKIYVIII